MIPLTSGDVACAARALMCVPACERDGQIREWMAETRAAAACVAAGVATHRDWGTGSLMSRVRLEPMAPEPFWDDPQFLACLKLVLASLCHKG